MSELPLSLIVMVPKSVRKIEIHDHNVDLVDTDGNKLIFTNGDLHGEQAILEKLPNLEEYTCGASKNADGVFFWLKE